LAILQLPEVSMTSRTNGIWLTAVGVTHLRLEKSSQNGPWFTVWRGFWLKAKVRLR